MRAVRWYKSHIFGIFEKDLMSGFHRLFIPFLPGLGAPIHNYGYVLTVVFFQFFWNGFYYIFYIGQDKQDFQDIFLSSSTSGLRPVRPTPRREEIDETQSTFGGKKSFQYGYVVLFQLEKLLPFDAINILSRRRRLGILYFFRK
jgi:hypothetical protein